MWSKRRDRTVEWELQGHCQWKWRKLWHDHELVSLTATSVTLGTPPLVLGFMCNLWHAWYWVRRFEEIPLTNSKTIKIISLHTSRVVSNSSHFFRSFQNKWNVYLTHFYFDHLWHDNLHVYEDWDMFNNLLELPIWGVFDVGSFPIFFICEGNSKSQNHW